MFDGLVSNEWILSMFVPSLNCLEVCTVRKQSNKPLTEGSCIHLVGSNAFRLFMDLVILHFNR